MWVNVSYAYITHIIICAYIEEAEEVVGEMMQIQIHELNAVFSVTC